MTTFKPGVVALATVRGVPNVRVMRTDPNGTCFTWCAATPCGDAVWAADSEVTDVRRLVVLDPADIPHTKGVGPEEMLHWLADQMEAQTRPPKPAEPTGLGAVVRVTSHRGAEYGNRLLVRGHATSQPWMGDGLKRDWDELEGPIEVLSEGVPADAGRD